MAYTISPALPSDAPAMAAVMQSAFKDDHIMSHFYPSVDSTIIFQRNLTFIRGWIDQGDVFGGRVTKGVESASGKIVAFSRWVYPVTLSAEDLERKKEEESRRPPPPEGANAALMDEFFSELGKGRERWIDPEKVFHCRVLCVDPAHQRKGLGHLLLREALVEADRMGATAFIEASPNGYGLYRKFGWEDVDELRVDLRKYGGDHVATQALMMREPHVVA